MIWNMHWCANNCSVKNVCITLTIIYKLSKEKYSKTYHLVNLLCMYCLNYLLGFSKTWCQGTSSVEKTYMYSMILIMSQYHLYYLTVNIDSLQSTLVLSNILVISIIKVASFVSVNHHGTSRSLMGGWWFYCFRRDERQEADWLL